MSERMTTVRHREQTSDTFNIGLTEHGQFGRAEMLTRMRDHYQWRLTQAQYVLNTPDEDFIVETHTGVIVRRNVKEVTDDE